MIFSPTNSFYFDFQTAYVGDVVVTDLDRDGLPEMTTTFFEWPGGNELTMAVYEIGLDGGITDIAGELAIGDVPTDVFGRESVAADLNGDGYEDYIVADHGMDVWPFPGAENTVWMSNGRGRYRDVSEEFSQGDDFTHSVAVGDIDGDGRQDVFFNNLNMQDSYVASVNRDGSVDFDAIDVRGIDGYTTVELVDLDGDGQDEVILGGDGRTSVLGDWNGNRLVYTDLPDQDFYSNGTINLDTDVVDINGDGLLDIAFTQTSFDPFYVGFTMQFLIQQPDGSFVDDTDTYWQRDLYSDPEIWETGVIFADLDNDGDLDFFTEGARTGVQRSYLQNEDGEFHYANGFQSTSFGLSVMVDVDFDGVDEVAVVGEWAIQFYDNGTTPIGGVFQGDDGLNIFIGTATAETFYGYGAKDIMAGGDGDDTMYGGTGNDRLFGDGGNDFLRGDEGRDRMLGGGGDDELRGGDDKDRIKGNGGADTLLGGSGVDRMWGGGDDDSVKGGDGNDKLRGGNGSDRVQGDAGDDTLNGSRGDDTLTGGDGADVFSVSRKGGSDRITDFDLSEDQLQLYRLNQFETFDEVAASMSDDGTDTLLSYNGGSFLIENVTIDELTADHFIL